MPRQEDYHVTLGNFEGPLDLLLYLIRRAEVDPADIPVATITDQYLAFLRQIEDIDVELAGDFLVMAATLIELKSRVLQPAGRTGDETEGEERPAEEAIDPRSELIQQLLAYQRYRDAAETLERAREEFANRFPRRPAPWRPDEPAAEDAEIELEDAHVYDLFEAYERIVATIDFSRTGEHRIEYDDTPIELHREDLVDRLGRSDGKRITLQEVFEGRRRTDVIGLFLATLELVKTRRVLVQQDEIGGEILLVLNESWAPDAMPDGEDEPPETDAGTEPEADAATE